MELYTPVCGWNHSPACGAAVHKKPVFPPPHRLVPSGAEAHSRQRRQSVYPFARSCSGRNPLSAAPNTQSRRYAPEKGSIPPALLSDAAARKPPARKPAPYSAIDLFVRQGVNIRLFRRQRLLPPLEQTARCTDWRKNRRGPAAPRGSPAPPHCPCPAPGCGRHPGLWTGGGQ